MNPDGLASAGWQARPATAADLLALCGLDGAEIAPVLPTETAWVAVQTGGPEAAGAAPAMATLRLRRQIGHPVPRAWFRLGLAVHASDELGLYRRQRTLLLGHDLTGASELAGLGLARALDPAEATPAWAVLVRAALAQSGGVADGVADDNPHHGEPAPCIVELPGVHEPDGAGPVWHGLGRHFHGQDPDAARRQHGPDWAHHLASLLPRHVLYAALLPEATQAALGQVAAVAHPLQRVLHACGFAPRDHISLTDGGLVLERWPPPAD